MKDKEEWQATQQLSRVGGFQVRCQKQDQDTRPDPARTLVPAPAPALAPERGVSRVTDNGGGAARRQEPLVTRSQSVSSSHADRQRTRPRALH